MHFKGKKMDAVKRGSRSPVRKEDVVIIQARGSNGGWDHRRKMRGHILGPFFKGEATGFADRLIKHGP